MTNVIFSTRLRQLIESKGYSIKRFSEEIEIPSATVSRYLSGDREPKLEYIIKICEYFGVSSDWLVGVSSTSNGIYPPDVEKVASLYSVASQDDKQVIRAVLSKYERGI